MKSPITYYYDESHTKRVPVNESGDPVLDWGEIIPGKRKEISLYIKNESHDQLVLRQPYTTDPTLKIEDYPQRLFESQEGIMKLSLTPKIESIKSHHASWGLEIVVG